MSETPNFDQMKFASEENIQVELKSITFDTMYPSGRFETRQHVELYMEEGCEDLIPSQAHDDDAGYDLKSNQDIVLQAGTVTLVHTGVHICMHPKYANIQMCTESVMEYHMLADVRSRSGLALKHGVFVLNSPGTIDQSYRGEICAIMFNAGKEPFSIKRGDRIAQLVFLYKPIVQLNVVDKEKFESLKSETDRGDGAFGSTGR